MTRKKYLPILAVVSLLYIFIASVATTSVFAATPTISKAYSYRGSALPGSIVRLVKGTKSTVIAANTSNDSSLIGVEEANKGSLLSINASDSTVQVAISGSAETLVSTVNGDIKLGDYIAVSPFGGMGMAASSGDSVIGVATDSFSSKSIGAKEQIVKNREGKNETVWTGEIPVNVSVGLDSSNSNTKLDGLQKLAHSITGHTIPLARVIAALVLAIVAFVIIVTLTYSASYSSIISIGRNPLASKLILKGIRMIVTLLFVVAFVASLIIYLLLS